MCQREVPGAVGQEWFRWVFPGSIPRTLVARILGVMAVALLASVAVAEERGPVPESVLDSITSRGLMLYAYDEAAWHGTDAVMKLKPDPASIPFYVAHREGDIWKVSFGNLDSTSETFIILYEAEQKEAGSTSYSAAKYISPKSAKGYLSGAVRSVVTCKGVFRPAVNRTYNYAVIPAPNGRFFVYFMPAQVEHGVYPFGGDVRYTVSPDGKKIEETRKLHNAFMEVDMKSRLNVSGSAHTAVVDELPEDTDIFHVLTRKPRTPEYVVSTSTMYLIHVDGRIEDKTPMYREYRKSASGQETAP